MAKNSLNETRVVTKLDRTNTPRKSTITITNNKMPETKAYLFCKFLLRITLYPHHNSRNTFLINIMCKNIR